MSRRERGRRVESGRDQPFPALAQRGRGERGRSGRGRGTDSGATTAAPEISTAAASSSTTSSLAQVSVHSLSGDVDKLTLQPAQVLPPSSSKHLTHKNRPGFGTVGRRITVRANHFPVNIGDVNLHQYDVSITPEVTSKKICRDVMLQLENLYRESHLGGRRLAYDGRKSVYTSGPFPFSSKDFVIKLVDSDGSGSSTSARREREFKVTIKFASKPDIYHLQQFLLGKQLDAPQETIQALDVVLRAAPSQMYTGVGRSFYSLNDLGQSGELANGVEYWRGYYQSLRPTQMGLSLNIDVSSRSFYEPIRVSDFVAKYLNRDVSRSLGDLDRVKVKRALRGVKVKHIRGQYVRTYKVTGITALPISQLTFIDDQNKKVSVVQYFREKYNIALENVSLPAIQSGSDTKPIYLPMDCCEIVEGQRYTKKLNERQVTKLLKATCQRPPEREASIKMMVKPNDRIRDCPVRKDFVIQVKEDLTLVDARVLPPPMLRYSGTGEAIVEPVMGQWNMTKQKMINGGKLEFWTCVNFSSYVKGGLQQQFCSLLIDVCKRMGMDVNPTPLIPIHSASANATERSLIGVQTQTVAKLKSMGQEGKWLQLLIVILPDVSGSYGKVKRMCETELGIVTQCCEPKQVPKLNKMYFENLALKINVKVGGRNVVLNDAILKKIPFVSDCPTIIFGADVTHPQPGEDASPSVAAVVASMDWPEVSKYRGLFSAQTHREEIIKDLYTMYTDPQKGLVHGGMIREMFMAFRRSTGRKPERIIFYRDGVSEGQFNQVLLYEVLAIREACASLEQGYQPPITFVVVQKRHHTRLFPSDHRNRNQTDKSGNIQPGTVVDKQICHPTEFDFYLNSHAGIQGTSRPTHYHVLYDENNFGADAMQTLTYNLCYTYVRCTRSVSIVPPAYYAHLAAFRARHYIDIDTSDGGSISGSKNFEVRSLPGIKDNVKNVMFYC